MVLISAIFLAVTPAAQVQAIAWLVRSTEGPPSGSLPPLIGLIVLIGVGQTLASVGNLGQQKAGVRLKKRFQDSLVEAVGSLSPSQMSDAETTAKVQAVRDALLDLSRNPWSVVSASSALLAAVGLFISIWFIAPLAAAVIVAALVPGLIVTSWAATMQHEKFGELGKFDRRTSYLVEQLVQQRTGTEIATLGSASRLARGISESQSHSDVITERILILLIRGFTIGGIVSALLLGLALMLIVRDGGGGAGVAAGVLGVISGIQATRNVGFAVGDVIATAPKVQLYREFIKSVDVRGPQSIVKSVDSIEVDNVTVNYVDAQSNAVDAVSLSISRGEIVAVVGANGAGKTSLINAILGIVDTSSGDVLIDGSPARAMSLEGRLSHFSLLTQEFGRYELTVRQVVALGMPGDSLIPDQAVWDALQTARLDALVAGFKDGLDTQLGQQFGGVGISGGQWQRLALARIALRDAAIWILDEPTSAVDAEIEREIFGDLLASRENRITIVVSHRAWTLRGMDRIYVMDEGVVVQCGTYDDLVSTPGRFQELFLGSTEVSAR